MADLRAVQGLIRLLQKCRHSKDLSCGRRLLAYMRHHRLDAHPVLGNYVVPMLVDCGGLLEAQQVFDRLPYASRNCWRSLISGYVDAGSPQQVLRIHNKMQEKAVQPDSYIYVALLKPCSKLKDRESGLAFHSEIIKIGLPVDAFIGNTLVDMYCKCDSLREARQVFDRLPAQDGVSWNALITGYSEVGLHKEVLTCYEQMLLGAISPADYTYVCSLKACGSLGDKERGQLICEEIARKGLDKDVFIGTTMLDMYAKCSSLLEAQKVFDQLRTRNVVSWNALIAGYIEDRRASKAVECFAQMQLERLSPDDITLLCGLKACGSTGTVKLGQEIHAELSRRGFDKELHLATALVDMYTNFGCLAEAQEVFKRLPMRDAPIWTALLTGYIDRGLNEEALNCFKKLQMDNVSVDASMYVCCLKACGMIGAIETGRELHNDIRKSGLERDLFVGSRLIDMYGKWGLPAEGRDVFDQLHHQNVVTWTAMIQAYAENCEPNMAIQCFENMLEQGVKPDAVTFTCLFAACSQASLVQKGQEYFNLMKEYCIEPSPNHYICIVDLLARSGHVCEAETFAEAMKCIPLQEVLKNLLSACKTYGIVDLGQRCFQQLIQLNPEDAAGYLLVEEMYTSACRWMDAKKVEEMRKHIQAEKICAGASIEVNKKVHSIIVGDRRSINLLLMLEFLSLHTIKEGYVPNSSFVLGYSSNEEDHESICCVSYDRIS